MDTGACARWSESGRLIFDFYFHPNPLPLCLLPWSQPPTGIKGKSGSHQFESPNQTTFINSNRACSNEQPPPCGGLHLVSLGAPNVGICLFVVLISSRISFHPLGPQARRGAARFSPRLRCPASSSPPSHPSYPMDPYYEQFYTTRPPGWWRFGQVSCLVPKWSKWHVGQWPERPKRTNGFLPLALRSHPIGASAFWTTRTRRIPFSTSGRAAPYHNIRKHPSGFPHSPVF